jgi:hypothetical protein
MNVLLAKEMGNIQCMVAYEGIRTVVQPREMNRNSLWWLLSMEEFIAGQGNW